MNVSDLELRGLGSEVIFSLLTMDSKITLYLSYQHKHSGDFFGNSSDNANMLIF